MSVDFAAEDGPGWQQVGKLLALGVSIGILLTAGAGVMPGSQGLNALTWVGTTATVTALVVAVGIYVAQYRQATGAHAELLAALAGQDELIVEFKALVPPPGAIGDQPDPDALTTAQRGAIEEIYGSGSIDAVWRTGEGKGNHARLVELQGGRLVTVYSGGRAGGTYVREVRQSN